ncbi:10688_t:CDS:2, partial [Ambispora leptoticha]
ANNLSLQFYQNIPGPTPPASDGRIIIFGGDGNNGNNGIIYGDLWILDIATYRWSIGNILNPIFDLTLYAHTATLVDNYMFVAFVMLNISQKDSYKWVTEFTPNINVKTTTTTTIPSNSFPSNTNISDPKNTGLVIGAIVG